LEIIDLPSLQKNKEEFRVPDPVKWDIFFEEETLDCILVLDIDYKDLTYLITYDNKTQSIKPIIKLNPILLKYPQLCKKYNIQVDHITRVSMAMSSKILIDQPEGRWVKGY